MDVQVEHACPPAASLYWKTLTPSAANASFTARATRCTIGSSLRARRDRRRAGYEAAFGTTVRRPLGHHVHEDDHVVSSSTLCAGIRRKILANTLLVS